MSAPTSGYIDNEAQAAFPPNPELDTGAEFHSCEYCKGFTLDFGPTDEELDRVVRDRAKDLLTAAGLTTTIIEEVKKLRDEYDGLATLSDTTDQVAQKANTGCQLYLHLSLAIDQQDIGASGILCAILDRENSSLNIYHVGTSVRYIESFPPRVARDNPLAGDILNRPIIPDPWSESTKSQVAQWMKDCSDTPEMCPNVESFFSPTYLIELSPCIYKCPSECPSDCCGFTLRLTKDTQGPVTYAALSYCWGGDQLFKTTKSNINNLLHNIRYADMPSTLKDAAKVAFDLNFRFLWIDALCLIQDPGEDEIHTMIAEIPNIYRHATLTIAAKSSKSVNEGFLHPRYIENYAIPKSSHLDGLCEVQIAIKNLIGKSGSATLPTYRFLERTPIVETRGWTLQEQILSKRYLSFSKTTTQWQFYGGSSDKGCFADGGIITTKKQRLDSISSEWKSLQFLKSPKTTRKHGQLWRMLVEEYMRRKLSIHKDRPIAISALASDLGDANDYVAGTWLSDLCYGLSWKPFLPWVKPVILGYYAPSWSWLSTPSLLVWLDTETSEMHQEPQFRLADCHLKLSHPSAPFGYLVEASLRVEACCGRVLVSDVRHSTLGVEYGTSGNVCLEEEFKMYPQATGVSWDYQVGFAKGQVLYLLVLFISKKGVTRICGLVLVDVKDNGSEKDRICRRVGVFDIDGYKQDDHMTFVEWVGNQPVETLTLV